MTRQLIALLLLCAAPSTWAQELTYIPKWHMVDAEACYDLEGAKQLMYLDGKLKLCESYRAANQDLIVSVGNYEKALQLKDNALKISTDALVATEAKLELEIKAKNDCVAKISTGPSVGWLVAGGLAILLTGLAAGAYFRR